VKNFFKAFLYLLLPGLAGCTHGEYRASTQEAELAFQTTQIQIELNSSSEVIARNLKLIRAIVDQKELSEQGIIEIEISYALYSTARALKDGGELLLAGNSRTRVDLLSFCLDPLGIAPSRNEPFFWKKEDPGVPYYSRLLRLVSRDESLAQEDAQELIWNLRNRAKYEDYPVQLKKVLDHIDPNARLLLPSHSKEVLGDSLKDSVRNALPELVPVEGAASFIEGRYQNYLEVADRLIHRSQEKSASTQESSLLFGLESKTGVYAMVRSSGFSRQTVTFFNTNSAAVSIDLSSYVLHPIDSTIQRIGLSTPAGLGKEVLSAFESALKDAIIRNSHYWYNGKLTPAEKTFIENHPIEALNAYAQSRRAILATWKNFGRNSDGDESDAFRHFVWAGLLTQQLGNSLASDFLAAHEQILSNAKQIDRMSSEMDRWNNDEGIKIAKAILAKGEFSLARVEKEARDAIAQGRLKVILPQGSGSNYPVAR
jgi:hypothetical protein